MAKIRNCSSRLYAYALRRRSTSLTPTWACGSECAVATPLRQVQVHAACCPASDCASFMTPCICMQIREREQQQEELRQQAARPFARTADDADRDMGLRDRMRFGDPMAGKIQRMQPAALPAPVVPAHMRKQMKKSGFVVPHVRSPFCLSPPCLIVAMIIVRPSIERDTRRWQCPLPLCLWCPRTSV